MPSPLDRQQIMPSQWGAKVDTTKPWADDAGYHPTLTIVHYGGGHNPAGGDEAGLPPYSFETECEVLRSWEHYHMTGKGMRSIAYNYGFGQSGHLYYLRGPNHVNGGQYGDINKTSRAVAFILGGAQVPSLAARRMFGRMWLEHPLSGIVKCHEDYYQTACPGKFLAGWVDRRGWLYDLGEWKLGSRGGAVSSIKVALHAQGYWPQPTFGNGFTPTLHYTVRRFQVDHGLTVDGIVGHDTFAALGGI